MDSLHRIGALPFVVFAFAFPCNAQGVGSPPVNVNSTNTITNPTVNTTFISGKVMVDDGTDVPDQVSIESVCNGRTHIETVTDSKGHFSFQIKSPNQPGVVSEDSSDSSQRSSDAAGLLNRRVNADPIGDYLRTCRLRGYASGFTSNNVDLSAKVSENGMADVGTLVLHRLGQVEGSVVSVTTAQAPANAKKEYDKGRDSARNEKWEAAEKHFTRAVRTYPNFAAAWVELGRLQMRRGDAQAARNSFHQALSADAKFVLPYDQLAQLAASERNWKEVLDTTNTLLKLDPVNFPEDWLLNAVANYSLNHFDLAEASALKGLELDKEGRYPKLEYILGLSLAQRQDYAGALVHIHNYLRLAPLDPDAENVRKQATNIARLAENSQK
ncbi:MAG TPA: tetratricopeptide repeat protein [Terriglobales bacterium]|nr:tetratricopeptide repeat protein [Terriglobales bacterium]